MPEEILDVPIEQEMQASYLDYAMSVIVSRALPDVRDGLKPVHRRILYAMRELGLLHNKPYKKSATVVGEVLGKYHPHGDMSVYDALVRMAQDFSMRYPLIDGQGNFGSIDGDAAAAYRYTEARLSRIAEEMLAEIEENTVDWVPNFDGRLKEPVVLPSRFPNLLANGCSGIAVGMATSVPPHNLSELVDGFIALIENPDITTRELMKYIKGPDFPTGGEVVGIKGLIEAYETGRGRITVRARYHIEERKGGREAIVITEIPYEIKKSSLIEEIAKLVRNRHIEDIADLRDESDRDGIRVVIELKRGADARIIINKLLKHTNMRTTYSIILLALVNGEPKTLSLKQMMELYLSHREEVVRRRTQFRLERAKRRAHIIEGLRIALEHIDEVVNIIKTSPETKIAKERLMKKFSLSEVQAQAILDMKLSQLTSLERDKLEREYVELIKEIEKLTSILASREAILEVIKEELLEIKKKYGDERRTRIIPQEEEELTVHDLIKEEDVVVTITHRGWVKRIPLSTYRRQGRGGVGVLGMAQGKDDFVDKVFIASTHDNLLIFTSKGKCYKLPVHELPEGSRVSKGRPVSNLLSMEKDEKIRGVIPIRDFGEGEAVLVTKRGTIKKVAIKDFKNAHRGGIIAQGIREGDELIDAEIILPHQEIMLITRKGQVIRFSTDEVRTMGRNAEGVRGVKLRGGDEVVSVVVVEEDGYLLFVTEKGYGKKVSLEEFRRTGRGGLGVIGIKVSEKTGDVAGAGEIKPGDGVMIITTGGQIIRLAGDSISVQHRASRGVRLITLKGDDRVSDVEVIRKREELQLSLFE